MYFKRKAYDELLEWKQKYVLDFKYEIEEMYAGRLGVLQNWNLGYKP